MNFAETAMPAGRCWNRLDTHRAEVDFGGPAVIVRAVFRKRAHLPVEKWPAVAARSQHLFITPAYAQAAGGIGTTDMLIQFAPLIFVFAIMYVLLFRPQQKRAAEHKKMIGNARRGDTIVTNGGIVGRVTKIVDDNELEAEIADGVRVRVVRSMIADVRIKGEPVKADLPKPAK
jgi:preprotein translocase subunit YajC